MFVHNVDCVMTAWKEAFALYGTPKGLTFNVKMHKDDKGNTLYARKINKNGHLTVDVVCSQTKEVLKTYLHKDSHFNVRTVGNIGKELHKHKFDRVNELIKMANNKKITLDELHKMCHKI